MKKSNTLRKNIALMISAVLVLSIFVGAFVFTQATAKAEDIKEISPVSETARVEYIKLGISGQEEESETSEDVFFFEEETAAPAKVASVKEEPVKSEEETTLNAEELTTVEIDNDTMELIKEVVRLTNIERVNNGLFELTLNLEMEVAAIERAREVATSFSHTRPDGTKWSTVFKQFGLNGKSVIGENVALGQISAEEVVADWMESETHRANILNENFSEISIGIYENDGVLYWSQLFAG